MGARIQTGTARALTTVVAFAAALAGIGWWWQTVEWPIDVVRIDGEVLHSDRDRLKAVMTRHAAAGWVGVDLDALQRDIVALPWVERASLRRIWPDTLQVEVDEHAPVAVWNGDALISARGQVFRPPTFDADGLARLSGPAGLGADMLQRLRRFESELAPVGLAIAALEQDARRAWRLTLSNGVTVQLGRHRIEQRLARFRAVWSRVLAPQAAEITGVDLRYTNGFAVAWRDGARPEPRGGGA